MKLRFALVLPVLVFAAGCASEDTLTRNDPVVEPGAGVVTASYSGRALFRSTQAPVADITIQVTGARDNGLPTDEVFGTTHTDTAGRFTVTSTAPRARRVVLVAAAVEEIAETGGDRRAEGYEIKKRATVLGSLPDPSPTGPNTLLVNPKQPGHPGDS